MATLEITTRVGCKNNCTYCPQKKLIQAYKTQHPKVLSFKRFAEIIAKIPHDVRIDFSGMAEPWLNSECTRMVSLAHEKNFSLAIYTTLMGMTVEDFVQIKDYPFRIFEVHLPDQENQTSISITEEYKDLLRQIDSTGVMNLNYMTIGTPHPEVAKIVTRKINCYQPIDRAGNVTEVAGIQAQQKLEGIIRCKSCGIDFSHNVLLPNGDVIICCMDYGLEYILGNLTRQNYPEIANSQKSKQLRAEMNKKDSDIICRYCHNAKESRWNYLPGASLLFKYLAS